MAIFRKVNQKRKKLTFCVYMHHSPDSACDIVSIRDKTISWQSVLFVYKTGVDEERKNEIPEET